MTVFTLFILLMIDIVLIIRYNKNYGIFNTKENTYEKTRK